MSFWDGDTPLEQGLSGGSAGFDDDGKAISPTGPGYSWNQYKSGGEVQGFDQDAHIFENQRFGKPGQGGTFDLGTASEHFGGWKGANGKTNTGFDFGVSAGQVTLDDGKHVQGPSIGGGVTDDGDTFSMGGGLNYIQGDQKIGNKEDSVDLGLSASESYGLQVHHGDAWGFGFSAGPVVFDVKSKTATDFVKKIPGEASAAEDWAKDKIGSAGEELGEDAAWAEHKASDVGHEISEDAGAAKDWAEDKASDVGHEISEDAGAAKDWAEDEAKGVGQGILAGAGAATDWAGGKVGSVTHAAGSLFRGIFD